MEYSTEWHFCGWQYHSPYRWLNGVVSSVCWDTDLKNQMTAQTHQSHMSHTLLQTGSLPSQRGSLLTYLPLQKLRRQEWATHIERGSVFYTDSYEHTLCYLISSLDFKTPKGVEKFQYSSFHLLFHSSILVLSHFLKISPFHQLYATYLMSIFNHTEYP